MIFAFTEMSYSFKKCYLLSSVKKSRCQFHQYFKSRFCAHIIVPKKCKPNLVVQKSCLLNFCTKKPAGKILVKSTTGFSIEQPSRGLVTGLQTNNTSKFLLVNLFVDQATLESAINPTRALDCYQQCAHCKS